MKLKDNIDQRMFNLALFNKGNSTCKRRQIGVTICTQNEEMVEASNAPIYHKCINSCLRTKYKTGKRLDLCPAIHAEAKAIAFAAYYGYSLKGATLYTTDCIPCKDCSNLILISGITRIVVGDLHFYDELSKHILYNSGIRLEDIEGAYL